MRLGQFDYCVIAGRDGWILELRDRLFSKRRLQKVCIILESKEFENIDFTQFFELLDSMRGLKFEFYLDGGQCERLSEYGVVYQIKGKALDFIKAN